MGDSGQPDGQERPDLPEMKSRPSIFPLHCRNIRMVGFIFLNFCKETFTLEIHVDGIVSKTTVPKPCYM